MRWCARSAPEPEPEPSVQPNVMMPDCRRSVRQPDTVDIAACPQELNCHRHFVDVVAASEATMCAYSWSLALPSALSVTSVCIAIPSDRCRLDGSCVDSVPGAHGAPHLRQRASRARARSAHPQRCALGGPPGALRSDGTLPASSPRPACACFAHSSPSCRARILAAA